MSYLTTVPILTKTLVKMSKYSLIEVNEIVTGIGTENAKIPGHFEVLITAVLPSDEQMKKQRWSNKKAKQWIESNNSRMESICQFLNENFNL